jgi:hypothetical protein
MSRIAELAHHDRRPDAVRFDALGEAVQRGLVAQDALAAQLLHRGVARRDRADGKPFDLVFGHVAERKRCVHRFSPFRLVFGERVQSSAAQRARWNASQALARLWNQMEKVMPVMPPR